MNKPTKDDRHELKRINACCDPDGTFSRYMYDFGFKNQTHGYCNDCLEKEYRDLGMTQEEIKQAIDEIL